MPGSGCSAAPNDRFPSTLWSRLLVASGADELQRKAALEALAERYWQPVAAYVRTRFVRDEDEARDVAQSFFLWVQQSGFLERADPRRGSFRGFVKASLSNFARDLARRRSALKRGGGRSADSLDEGEDWSERLEAGPDSDPERALDDAWRRALFAEAARALEAELRQAGRARDWELFRDTYLADEAVAQHELARRHALTRSAVSHALERGRRRYRALLRAAVHETVGDDDELRAELAWLLEGERDDG